MSLQRSFRSRFFFFFFARRSSSAVAAASEPSAASASRRFGMRMDTRIKYNPLRV